MTILKGVRMPRAKFGQDPLKNVAVHNKPKNDTQTDAVLYTRLLLDCLLYDFI